MPDLTDTIETTATDGIQKAAVDGRSAEGIPLPDLIEADKYLKNQDPPAGPKTGWARVRMARAVPPGSDPAGNS